MKFFLYAASKFQMSVSDWIKRSPQNSNALWCARHLLRRDQVEQTAGGQCLSLAKMILDRNPAFSSERARCNFNSDRTLFALIFRPVNHLNNADNRLPVENISDHFFNVRFDDRIQSRVIRKRICVKLAFF